MLSNTPKQLKKIRGELVYLDRQYARMRSQERKDDTRRKIQLGGLLKKVGLENESTAVLYGLLLEAAEKLVSNDHESHRLQWKLQGELAFLQEKETDEYLL